jgi:hypothetical protein
MSYYFYLYDISDLSHSTEQMSLYNKDKHLERYKNMPLFIFSCNVSMKISNYKYEIHLT